MPLYIGLIKYLICQLQIRLPYHIPNIDSNDEIFTKDENYKEEANNLIENIIDLILEDITLMDSKINKNSLEDVEFLSSVCLSSAELFQKYFEQTKYSNSIAKKMVELAKKYLDNFKNNKKTDLSTFPNIISLMNLCCKFDF